MGNKSNKERKLQWEAARGAAAQAPTHADQPTGGAGTPAAHPLSRSRQPGSGQVTNARFSDSPRSGICDLCNSQIDPGRGFVFYSDTFPAGTQGADETGAVMLCDGCTNAYITKEWFRSPPEIPSLSLDDFRTDIRKARAALRHANVAGIIRVCTAHGFGPAEARSKAQEFASLYWQDKQRCIRESVLFWKSTVGFGPPYTLANCIEVLGAYYAQRNLLPAGPVGGTMLRKALHSVVTCPDCGRTFDFHNGVETKRDTAVVFCPLCKSSFATVTIADS